MPDYNDEQYSLGLGKVIAPTVSYVRDTIAFYTQLRSVTKNSYMFTDKIELHPESIAPPSSILKKFASIYRKAAQKKDNEMYITPTNDMETRAAVYADAGLLEQALGNVLNNAIKYSYIGTRINMDVRIDKGECVYSVTDYGSTMSNQEANGSIFQYGVRGANARYMQDGCGLGLFIVKQIIVDAHNGSLKLLPLEKVSDYNVGLLGIVDDGAIPESIKDSWREERSRLKASGLLDVILSNNSSFFLNTPRLYLERNWLRETWKKTFVVSIPINNENSEGK